VGIVILLGGGLRWWAWVSVAAVTTAMSVSLLFIGLHWLSDVLGGLLIAVTVTTAFGASPLGPELVEATARDHRDEPVPSRKPGIPA
jgi:membrane-associated phospholipid phosphatase